MINNACTDCVLDVLAVRSQFKSLNQWLIDRLSDTTSVSSEKAISKYLISGKEVCQVAWCKIDILCMYLKSPLVELWQVYLKYSMELLNMGTKGKTDHLQRQRML